MSGSSLAELDLMSEDTFVYLCDPEFCDNNSAVHVEPPVPFLAWRIENLRESMEVYASFYGDMHVIPAADADVKPIVAWRMPCGAWKAVEPLHTTVAEAKRVRESW